MKNYLLYFIIIFCFLFYFQSFSQDVKFPSRKDRDKNKPSLFTNDSAVSKLQPSFIDELSKVERHDIVNLHITHYTKLEGIVVRADRTDRVVTITVKSLEINGLTLIFSDIRLKTEEHFYRAILMSNDYKDALTLENNHWYKKEMADIIPD